MSQFKLRQTEQGLTLLEVLVSIFFTFLILMGGLQVMVSSAILRIQAREESDGLMWIREDSEYISYLATQDDLCTVDSNGNSIPDRQESGIAYALTQVADFPVASQTRYLSGTDNGRQYALKRLANPKSTDPADNDSNILELTYVIDYAGDGKACEANNEQTWDNCVVTSYLEIIPDEAFTGCS